MKAKRPMCRELRSIAERAKTKHARDAFRARGENAQDVLNDKIGREVVSSADFRGQKLNDDLFDRVRLYAIRRLVEEGVDMEGLDVEAREAPAPHRGCVMLRAVPARVGTSRTPSAVIPTSSAP
jgi:hypothetical protein